MKRLLKLLCPSIVLFSILGGCNLFSPENYAEKLTPIDSMSVFHNLINSYNTMNYDLFTLCLDSASFKFIPEDTTRGSEYRPWGYSEEDALSFNMFNLFRKSSRIPPMFLQIDTTSLNASDTLMNLKANYLLLTPLEEYDTLAGGFELEIVKRGNYWYISEWKDVQAETLFIPIKPDKKDTTGKTIDTILPKNTLKDWSDLKVYFLSKYGYY